MNSCNCDINSTPIKRTSLDFKENLIAEVQNSPIIYNKYSRDYKNIKKKAQAWREIANNVGKSEETCKRTWRNLRDKYVKALYKSLKMDPNNAGKPVYQWLHFENMNFLRDHVTVQKSLNNTCTEVLPTFPKLESDEVSFSPTPGIFSDSYFDDGESSIIEQKMDTEKEAREIFLSVLEKANKFFSTNIPKERNKHEGFLSMVADFVDEVDISDQNAFKVQILNVVQNEVSKYKENKK